MTPAPPAAPDRRGPLVLVTGSTGFVGGAVAAAARATPGVRLRLTTRRPTPAAAPGTTGYADSTVHADLAEPAGLRGICDGVDVLLHCAARIGGPAASLAAVNEHGTRALVAEAHRAGVRRIVYLSTASVYGRGTFRAAGPGDPPQAPASPTSASRAAAERMVLAAGGTVLRPHLVVGAGDRWVVPGLVRLHRQLAATVDGGRTLHSTVDVADLARVAVALALAPGDVSGAWHPDHPEPVSCAAMFDALTRVLGLPPVAEDVDRALARERLADDPQGRHHLEMLVTDHWFDSARTWRETGCRTGLGFAAGLGRHADWYRRHLGLTGTPA